jgi:23S rRNA pseudouridine2605 synthase
MELSERIQKILASRGIASRRACEEMIVAGRVTCNGEICILGQSADPDKDILLVDGQPIPASEKPTYIMLHKPKGYVTTMSDEKGRKIAADLVTDVGTRVYPVGRLDMYSEGLLLFTDDGELANKLTHPSHSIPKHYLVKVKGALGEDQMSILTSDMELDGYKLRPIKARIIKNGETDRFGEVYSTLKITLYEGRNRQIRQMCEKSGIVVMRLKRIAIGDIKLDKLEAGKWRHLTTEEIEYLKNN